MRHTGALADRPSELALDWRDLHLFLTLMRSGSVREAGRQLGVSHSTLARRMSAFEASLGARLFDRTGGGYVPTQAGEDMLATAENAEREISALQRRIVGLDQKLSGVVRITLADFLATDWLMGALGAFAAEHPEIDLHMLTTYDALDLDRREADIALRITRAPPQHLIGRKLATIGVAAYARADYLDRHGLGPDSGARWIGYGGLGRSPAWVKRSALPHLKTRGDINSILAQAQAAKAGMGVAMLPCMIGEAERDLIRIPAQPITPSFDLWLLTHRDMRLTARLRACKERIAEAVLARLDLIEGRL